MPYWNLVDGRNMQKEPSKLASKLDNSLCKVSDLLSC